MKKEEDKPEQGVNVSLAEEIYDAFANWYHDDGSYDTFLRSEAWKLIDKYASSVSGEGKEAVEALKKALRWALGELAHLNEKAQDQGIADQILIAEKILNPNINGNP